MLRALIVLAALVWLAVLLSGTGRERLRPALEAARRSGEAITVIDPLHGVPLSGRPRPDASPGDEAREGPATPPDPSGGAAGPTPAPSAAPPGGAPAASAASGPAREAPPEGAPAVPERRARNAPVFTLSDLPPAGEVEPVPRDPADPDDLGEGPAPDPSAQEGPAQEGLAQPGAEAAPGPGAYVITAEALNLRDAPSTRGAVLGRLGRGDRVRVIARPGTGWAEVLARDGTLRGFVSARFLAPAP